MLFFQRELFTYLSFTRSDLVIGGLLMGKMTSKYLKTAISLLFLMGNLSPVMGMDKPAKVLFVTENGSRTVNGTFDFSSRNVIHYNHFSLDITKKKPYRDDKGRLISIPETRTFNGVYEITYHFWHPRNERRLLDAIVVKTYDRNGHLLKHGAFDRGVFVVILTNDLFHGQKIEFLDIGKFIRGDQSLYVKVRIEGSRRIALVPFTTFLTDFTRKINTVPVASWAVR